VIQQRMTTHLRTTARLFLLPALTLLSIALSGCAAKSSADDSIYNVEIHPEISRAADLKSFSTDSVALSYSLHTETEGDMRSIRLDIVDPRFEQAGEHIKYRVICTTARFMAQDDYAIPSKPAGTRVKPANSPRLSAGNSHKFEDRYVVILPGVELGEAPPTFDTDASGNRIKTSATNGQFKQRCVVFVRPGYSLGGYH
jgi:hypothetical protein